MAKVKGLTKKEKLLNYLLTHRRGITGKEAWLNIGLYRLSGEIKQLRDAGYNILTSMEEEVDENGNPIRYARYYLGRQK